MNKTKSLLISGLLLFSGCSLFFSGPSSVVKKLMSDSWNGDVEAMVKLWSRKAIEEQGLDHIRKNAEGFVEIQKRAKAGGEDMRVEKIRETIQGDRARVFFLYRDSKGKDSIGLGFALIKEDGNWKLYRAIGGEEEESFESSFEPRESPATAASEEPASSPLQMVAPIPPPPVPGSSNRKTENSNSPTPTTNSAPVSGGVMNGKAVSLPQPAYPPAARAVKASGTVVVQVSVDESGRVASVHAVSGHPLLRAAAEAAARNARFKPTLVGGQAVKVNGTLTYKFSAE
jgi:TonB family protein